MTIHTITVYQRIMLPMMRNGMVTIITLPDPHRVLYRVTTPQR